MKLIEYEIYDYSETLIGGTFMKKYIKANNEDNFHIKDSDWYRLINRVERQTGMKVTSESRWDKDRNWIELIDDEGELYHLEVEKKLYYEVDTANSDLF